MYNSSFYFMSASMKPLFYLLMLLDLVLKGVTLYKSARKDQKIWFVALLVVNSLGILPIIYLLINKDLQFGGVAETRVSKKATKKKRA